MSESRALVVRQQHFAISTFEDVARASKYFAQSGMFPDIKDEAQAAVKVLAGQELGVGPFAAMKGIYIIKGQIALSANLMAALVKGSGRYDYRITRLDNEVATLEMLDGGKVAYVSTFTIEDAKAAAVGGGENWRKFPRNMLFARALSNGARWVCPHVLMGAYVREELGAELGTEDMVVNESTGEIIDAVPATSIPTAAEPESQPAQASSAPKPLMPKYEQLATHLKVKRLWTAEFIEPAVALLKLRGLDREATAAQVDRWDIAYKSEPDALLAELQAELALAQQPGLLESPDASRPF